MDNSLGRTSSGSLVSELIVAVFGLNGRLLAGSDCVVSGAGLTSARWRLLEAIAVAVCPETVAGMARSMSLSRQGVQRLVDEMVDADLIELCDNPRHRCARLVALTPRGRTAFGAAQSLHAVWVNRLGDRFDIPGLVRAQRVLEDISDRLDPCPGAMTQRAQA